MTAWFRCRRGPIAAHPTRMSKVSIPSSIFMDCRADPVTTPFNNPPLDAAHPADPRRNAMMNVERDDAALTTGTYRAPIDHQSHGQ